MSSTANTSVPSLAIIGGGIFGLTAAIEAAKLKVNISVFDRSSEILQGASKLNNGVVHMGYHYPRSLETVLQSKRGCERFQARFPDCVMSTFDKYYCIASEGSLTTAKEYLAFCEQAELPYRIEFPPDPFINRERVDLSIRVPEAMFDYRRVRNQLLEQLSACKKVTLLRQHIIIQASLSNQNRKRLRVSYNGEYVWQEFDFVLNASYANTNAILSMFGGELFDLQYELSEVPLISIPWRADPIGVTVMDGPFCALNPFGFSNCYTITHVELSIRERSIGDFAAFECQEAPLNDCRLESGTRILGDCNLCQARPSTNFHALVEKSQDFFPILARSHHERSYFVMRCVLAKRDFDDARPTLVHYMGSGVWTIFGGKVDTCLDAAENFRTSLEAHLFRGTL